MKACHPEKNDSEWWYYNGHLAAGERRFGFHLAFFHGQIERIRLSRHFPFGISIPNLWSAHFGLADLTAGTFRCAQRRVPGTGATAGVEPVPGDKDHRVWIDDWSAEERAGRHILRTDMEGVCLKLELDPLRPRVRHGSCNGEFRKTDRHVSSYVSHSRLAAVGCLTLKGIRFDVTGEAWCDHESGSAGFGPEIGGWDWFSIQFANGSELMVYGLRDHQGALTRHACATRVSCDGNTQQYGVGQIQLEPLDWWESPSTGSVYATGWRLRLGETDADLRIRACVRCCEIDARGSAGIIYWDGPATVGGTWQGSCLEGRAYIEQVARNQRGKTGVFDFHSSSIGVLGWLADEFWLRRHGSGRTLVDPV